MKFLNKYFLSYSCLYIPRAKEFPSQVALKHLQSIAPQNLPVFRYNFAFSVLLSNIACQYSTPEFTLLETVMRKFEIINPNYSEYV
jgi:hypothetical protein